ncbi:hypothetical protein IEQ34_003610 [Dendrobium chrysotoxum]|uniref:Uncharacterized protein n=1 Tax=Dendrobium chrysotoxum TaxID=161865 RepID=A0AAV7HJM9_DENCH|nr:hypothetical protein IEQ34_003610 [Dendrobium chrysotoxum]
MRLIPNKIFKCGESTPFEIMPFEGYLTVYEMSLQISLRFPFASELINILIACKASLSQFLCRVI